MKYEEPQPKPAASPEPMTSDSLQEGEILATAPTPEETEDYFDNSVFPHFWLCVPVALALRWQFYVWFGTRLFFYRAGISKGYGMADFIGPAWLLMPLLFAALLFFPFWNMRFAREAGDTKAQSLHRGLLTMGVTFLIALFIVWMLNLNVRWR